MSKECSGDSYTEATESTLDSMLEQMSIAKGKIGRASCRERV